MYSDTNRIKTVGEVFRLMKRSSRTVDTWLSLREFLGREYASV